MPTLELLSAEALRSTVVTFRDHLKVHQAGINRLNVYPVPDGDTGTNMARTLDAVVAELDQADAGLAPTCDAISHGSLMGARGNSGVILSQILRGLAGTLRDAGEATGATVAAGLRAASTAAYQAVLKPIEGTILTVVRAAADGAGVTADGGGSLAAVLHSARASAREALARTPDLLPVLKDAGVVDAGGAGFVLLLDAALHVVDGEPLPEPDEGPGPSAEQLEAAAHRHAAADGEVDVSELRYEVMYFLDLADDRIEAFKQGWGAIGDSIVVVGGDGLWNCHVHTNDIGAAIEVALDLDGRPRQIRVTDLFEEMAEEHAHREAALHGGHPPFTGHATSLPPVTCAVVAVASGDGLVELFGNLGVQGVVTGGQTLNPSTAELLAAVEAVNAEQVVVLPNNKNIIPAAEQLDALSSKRIVVVPTRSMPEALAALVVYDPEADVDANAEEMTDAAASVATGEVTQAVRATASPAGPIAEGDWIGLVRGDGIVAVGSTVTEVAIELLGQLVGPGREIVTIVTGVDAIAATTESIAAWLHDQLPQVQVEIHHGGQPLYPFLFGVE
ncbi:MAG: DAK2 domain-containing protein [Actinobacteria bacterium]|nr:DAK2 domain-containing protein [Actinomycetota bacterium]